MATTAAEVASTDATQPRPAGYPMRLRRPDLLVIGVYVAVGIYACGAYWLDVNDRVSSHLPQDHTWFQWLFSHGAYSVRHLENPLFSTRQNAPDGVNMMANTSMIGVTLPMAPITLLLGPQIAYVLYLGGAMAGTAATTFWVLTRRLGTSRLAASFGGAVVGFAPGVVHHASGQPNFVSNFLLPLIVARVMMLGDHARWRRNGVVLGLLVAYSVFINEELLLMTALACAVAVLAYAAQRWRDARARLLPFLGGLGLTALVAGVVTAYPIWFQFNGPQSYRGLNKGVFHSWGEDFAAYVTFSHDSIVGSRVGELTLGKTEQNTWFGWPLVVLSLVVVVALWRRSVAVRTAAITGAVFVVAAIGPAVRVGAKDTGIRGPWAYIPDDVPMLEMLVPTRLALIVAGVVGLLVAVGWDAAVRLVRASGPRRILGYATVALTLVCMVALIPKPLPAKQASPVPHFITSGAWRPYVPPGRTLIPVPLPNDRHADPREGLVTFRWSAVSKHEFAVPGGYFIGPDETGEGYFGAPPRPTAWTFWAVAQSGQPPLVDDEMRRIAREDIRYWKGAVVVLGPHPNEEGLRRLLTDLFGHSGQRVDDVWLWDVRTF